MSALFSLTTYLTVILARLRHRHHASVCVKERLFQLILFFLASYSNVDMSSQEAYEMAAQGLLGPQGKTVPIMTGLRCIHFQPPHFTLGKRSSSATPASCQRAGSLWPLCFSHPPQRCRLSTKLRNIYAELCMRLDWSCGARPCVKESGGPEMEASRCTTPSPGNTGQSRASWRPSDNITCPRKGRKRPGRRLESRKNATKKPRVARVKPAMTQCQ